MATGAALQAVINDCRQFDPDWSDLAKIVKRALINAYLDQSNNCIIPIGGAGQNGASVTLAFADTVAFYKFCLTMDRGGVYVQFNEFNDPNRYPGFLS